MSNIGNAFSGLVHPNDTGYYVRQIYVKDGGGNTLQLSDIPGFSQKDMYQFTCDTIGMVVSAYAETGHWAPEIWGAGAPALTAFGDVYFDGESWPQALLRICQ